MAAFTLDVSPLVDPTHLTHLLIIMNTANMLLGLGGTGAKILCELAELLSQDSRWVAHADTDLYFLLIDTDTGDLEACQGRIRSALKSAYCEVLPLAQNLTTLSPLLSQWCEKFEDLKTSDPSAYAKGMKRFAEHWWFPQDEEPSLNPINAFQAQRVQNIHSGAGQVPAVSHFCTWNRMKEISQAYRDMFQAVQNRRAGGLERNANPVSAPNVFFLGSFAGGTGRGALIPAAFRFKQDFIERFDSTVSPSLYVFDASCFEQILKPSEINTVYMNALSGFSELSAWEEIHKAPPADPSDSLFFLPGPSNPADPEHDLVGFTRIKNAESANFIRPFDTVSLTFRQAERIEASSPDQLYSMVAGALYVRMTQTSVGGRLVNEGRGLISIGSSSCRVDVQSIKNYYRDKARYDTLFRLQAPVDIKDLQARSKEHAAAIIARRAALDDAPASLLLKEVPSEKSKASNIFEMFSFLLMQKDAFGGQAMDALTQALHEQSLSRVEDVLGDSFDSNGILSDGGRIQEFAALFERAIAEYAALGSDTNVKDAATWMDEIVGDIVSCAKRPYESVFAETGSAALAGAVAGLIRDRFNAFCTQDLSRASLIKLLDDREPDLRKKMEDVSGRSGILVGKRFDESEIQMVQGTARQTISLIASMALGLALKSDTGPLAALRKRLTAIETNAKCVVDASKHLIQMIAPDEIEKQRKNCFVTRDADGRPQWHDLTNSLLAYDADQRFVKRIIKPLEPTAADGLFLSVGEFGPAITEILAGDEIPEPRRRAVKNPELLDTMRDTMNRQVRYVMRDPASGVNQDVSSLVQFGPALRELWNAWTDELNSHLQDADFEDLCQKFQNFFGVEPRMTPNRDAVQIDGLLPGIAPDESPILAMAVSLARTCYSFWRLKREVDSVLPHVIIMIPIEIRESELDAWKRILKDRVGGEVDVISNKPITLSNGNKAIFNPFILSAYCSDGTEHLDNIESLTYWSTRPEVKGLMRRIDRPDCLPAQFATARPDDPVPERRSLFEGYRGSGFADPCYLHNPTLRKLRWRPWVDKEQAEEDRRSDEIGHVSLVTLYAVWGPAAFLEGSDFKDKALQVMRNCGWPETSILLLGDKERISLQRFPAKLTATGMSAKSQPMPAGIDYDIGGNIDQSLGNLAQVFMKKRPPRFGEAAGALALFAGAEREFREFCEILGEQCGFHPKKNARAFGDLMRSVADQITQFISTKAPAQDDREVLEKAHVAASGFNAAA